MDKSKLYRSIPKVDVLLADEEIQGLIGAYSRDTVMEAIRTETDALRAFIGACRDDVYTEWLVSEFFAFTDFIPDCFCPCID